MEIERLETGDWGEIAGSANPDLQSPISTLLFPVVSPPTQRIEHRAHRRWRPDQVLDRAVVDGDVLPAVATHGSARVCWMMARRSSLVSGTSWKMWLRLTSALLTSVGILRRGADEDDRAVLDPGQQRILLGLVEAVHLVDEEDGALVVEAEPDSVPHRWIRGCP